MRIGWFKVDSYAIEVGAAVSVPQLRGNVSVTGVPAADGTSSSLYVSFWEPAGPGTVTPGPDFFGRPFAVRADLPSGDLVAWHSLLRHEKDLWCWFSYGPSINPNDLPAHALYYLELTTRPRLDPDNPSAAEPVESNTHARLQREWPFTGGTGRIS